MEVAFFVVVRLWLRPEILVGNGRNGSQDAKCAEEKNSFARFD
jgi:hypothetical protein